MDIGDSLGGTLRVLFTKFLTPWLTRALGNPLGDWLANQSSNWLSNSQVNPRVKNLLNKSLRFLLDTSHRNFDPPDRDWSFSLVAHRPAAEVEQINKDFTASHLC